MELHDVLMGFATVGKIEEDDRRGREGASRELSAYSDVIAP